MEMFKIGDKVRRVRGGGHYGAVEGGTYTVSWVDSYKSIKLKEFPDDKDVTWDGGNFVLATPQFKVGDKVRITQPSSDTKGWHRDMDVYDNFIGVIESVTAWDYYVIKGAGQYSFCFHPDWLELVTEDTHIDSLKKPVSTAEVESNVRSILWPMGGAATNQLTNNLTNNNMTILKSIKDKIKGLDPDTRLLRKLELESEEGEPTREGLELANMLCFKEKRAEIVKLAREMEDEEKKANKKK